MQISKYLSEPIFVRNMFISSRLFFAPINTGFANKGEPDERFINFHRSRSGKDIGISYIGNVAIGERYVTNDNTSFFTGKSNIWKLICETINSNGSTPGIQLGCRYSNLMPQRDRVNSKKQEYIINAKEEFESFSVNIIEDIINNYIECAIYASKSGFSVIQIHAAHGYFLSLSLSKYFNQRKDEFGKNKLLILEKIIKGIRAKLPDTILDVRVSLYEGVEEKNNEYDYKIKLISDLAKLDVDIISISNGIYNLDKNYIYPQHDSGHGIYIEDVLNLAKRFKNKIWNVAGNIWNLDYISNINQFNLTFSIGRALICDPKFIEKYFNNQKSEIKQCIGCNKCHYYSKGEASLNGCLFNI